jgi:ornithine cyclodeaminase
MKKDDRKSIVMQSVPVDGSILAVRSADVRRHLPMGECIAMMEDVFRALAERRAVQPLRHVVRIGEEGSLYVMPGFLRDDEAGALAVKMVTLYPGNAGRGLESHQGAIVLFDASDGRVRALIEAGSVTAIRTAAVSGLATRLLALPDASDLALLGSGVQAESHLAAMLEVRPIRRVRVWSRTAAHAMAFARRASAQFGISVELVDTAEAALRGATVVCTVTGSPAPITRSEWIADGAHINAVGASTAATREIDSATVARASLVVDARDAALAEAGDLLIPIGEGLVAADSLMELCDVVAGRVQPRTHPTQVTLFESLGLAVEDAAAARAVYERALAAGAESVSFD